MTLQKRSSLRNLCSLHLRKIHDYVQCLKTTTSKFLLAYISLVFVEENHDLRLMIYYHDHYKVQSKYKAMERLYQHMLTLHFY